MLWIQRQLIHKNCRAATIPKTLTKIKYLITSFHMLATTIAMFTAVTICWPLQLRCSLLSPYAEPLPLRLISQSCHFVCLGLQRVIFRLWGMGKKSYTLQWLWQVRCLSYPEQWLFWGSAQNETDVVTVYILYLEHFLMCWMFDKMLWEQNIAYCVYRLYLHSVNTKALTVWQHGVGREVRGVWKDCSAFIFSV